MAWRIRYVQTAAVEGGEQPPGEIAWVEFNRTWRRAYVDGLMMRRHGGRWGNYIDIDTGLEYLVTEPTRRGADGTLSPKPTRVAPNAQAAYQAFLDGEPLPGRGDGPTDEDVAHTD